MATQVKHRRGTQSEIDNFTPAIAEIVVNTTESELALGDGVNQGGVPIAKKRNTVLSFDTLSDAITNTSLKAGYVVELKERAPGDGGGGTWDVVLASTVTPNTFNIVQCTGVASLALVLRADIINIKQVGAKGDGVTDDTNSIQAALDTGLDCLIPKGQYRTTSTLFIRKPGQKLIGLGRSQSNHSIDCYAENAGSVGDVAAIKFEGESSNITTLCGIENVYINVRNANVVGVDFTELSYGSIKDLFIRMYAANQSGVYAKGNGQGTGPYYNNIDGLSVFGQNDPVGAAAQIGILFARATSGAFLADGPNGNNITNINRIAGVERGIDIRSGNGNNLTNVQLEAINTYGIAFNNHGGPETKALGNNITNVRNEGGASSTFCRFFDGAKNNIVSTFYQTSIGSVKWQNDADANNMVLPKGSVQTYTFYGQDIPANDTVELTPIYTGAEGGIQMAMSSAVHSIAVGVNRFGAGGLGSGTVRILRNNLERTDMDLVVDDANRFGSSKVAPTYEPAATAHLFDAGSRLQCKITTDASWNQTTADVHVTVVMVIL